MARVLSTQEGVVVPSFADRPAPGFASGYGVVLALFATSPIWLGAVGLQQALQNSAHQPIRAPYGDEVILGRVGRGQHVAEKLVEIVTRRVLALRGP